MGDTLGNKKFVPFLTKLNPFPVPYTTLPFLALLSTRYSSQKSVGSQSPGHSLRPTSVRFLKQLFSPALLFIPRVEAHSVLTLRQPCTAPPPSHTRPEVSNSSSNAGSPPLTNCAAYRSKPRPLSAPASSSCPVCFSIWFLN